jgi:hypothetical protein
MANPSLLVEITKETLETELQVTFQVLEFEQISPAVFVKERIPNEYDRVAKTYDLEHVYDSPVDGERYYRDTSFSKTFPFEEVSFANTFVSTVTRMINDLVNNVAEGSFDSTEEVEFPLS